MKLGVQYLKEAGWAEGGRLIACTQPRRLAVQVLFAEIVLIPIGTYILFQMDKVFVKEI